MAGDSGQARGRGEQTQGGQCDLSSGFLSRLWASLGVTASGNATVRDASGYVSFVIRSEEDVTRGGGAPREYLASAFEEHDYYE